MQELTERVLYRRDAAGADPGIRVKGRPLPFSFPLVPFPLFPFPFPFFPSPFPPLPYLPIALEVEPPKTV